MCLMARAQPGRHIPGERPSDSGGWSELSAPCGHAHRFPVTDSSGSQNSWGYTQLPLPHCQLPRPQAPGFGEDTHAGAPQGRWCPSYAAPSGSAASIPRPAHGCFGAPGGDPSAISSLIGLRLDLALLCVPAKVTRLRTGCRPVRTTCLGTGSDPSLPLPSGGDRGAEGARGPPRELPALSGGGRRGQRRGECRGSLPAPPTPTRGWRARGTWVPGTAAWWDWKGLL